MKTKPRSVSRWWTLPPFRGKSSAGLDPGRPAAFTRNFAESNARTEQDFLGLGQTLRRLYSVATELTGLVGERAGALRAAMEQSRLTGSHGLAAQSLQELHSTLDATSGLLCSLREAANALQQLRTPVRAIGRIGLFLESSAVNFAIETRRSSFQSIAGETSRLADELERGLGVLPTPALPRRPLRPQRLNRFLATM